MSLESPGSTYWCVCDEPIVKIIIFAVKFPNIV